MVTRAYISAARKLSPSVPKELEEYVAAAYSGIRQEEARSNTPHSYTTIRTLLSILRISAVSFVYCSQNLSILNSIFAFKLLSGAKTSGQGSTAPGYLPRMKDL